MQDAEQTKFIEVMKIVTNWASGKNTHSEPHLINIKEIKSARGWHKNENDRNEDGVDLIPGDIAVIVLYKDEVTVLHNDGNGREKFRPRTMLIQESYPDFKQRLSMRVPVNSYSSQD